MIAAPLLISGIIIALILGVTAGVASEAPTRKGREAARFYGFGVLVGVVAIIVALFFGSLNEGWFA